MNVIELDSVCKSFGAVRAVDALSIRVPDGCVYGFLGPNGAGKTTTLRMLMDIIRPDSGAVRLFGDGRGLYRKMTATNVLSYFGALKGVPPARLAEASAYWLDRVGLAAHARKKVEELSRGMHQKLQFAVTAINDPALLILDEPFSGLDPVNQDLLREIIDGMRAAGKTVLFSTHVMHEAERLCDFIVLINRGAVVVDGTLESIRAGHESHTVSLELDGDAAFVEALPLVVGVTAAGRRCEVELSEGADPQDLLKALVDRVQVRAFEIKRPSLHEIFVRLVGGNHAQDH